MREENISQQLVQPAMASGEHEGGRRINIVVDGGDNFPVANILYDCATDSLFINRGASPLDIDAAISYITGIITKNDKLAIDE